MNARIPKYYIAYGSNLNLEQMKTRCPTAELKGKAVLKDYRLRFYGSPMNSVATIESRKGSAVPVLIWQIFDEDEKNLDIYEGFPRLYRKEVMEVDCCDQPTNAMIYVMNTDLCPLGLPSKTYYQTILTGYREAGFDPDILREAVLSVWEEKDNATWDEDMDDEENNNEENASMTEEIRKQIMAIRDSGETNMFDIRTVQYIANREEYYELVIYLEEHPKEYVHFIMTGEEP